MKRNARRALLVISLRHEHAFENLAGVGVTGTQGHVFIQFYQQRPQSHVLHMQSLENIDAMLWAGARRRMFEWKPELPNGGQMNRNGA